MPTPIEDQLTRARVRLLLTHPFYSVLMRRLTLVELPEIPTMSTDGRHIFYNPQWVATLSPEQTMAALAHEPLHPALLYWARMGARNPELWNIVHDMAINQMLLADKFTFWTTPKPLFPPPGCEGMNAEQLYDVLLRERGEDGEGQDGLGAKFRGRTCSGCERGEDEKGGEGEAPGQNGEQDGEGQGQSQDAWDPIRWKRELLQAATASRMAGKMPGHLEELVNELVHPVLPWLVILRDFVSRARHGLTRLVPSNKKHLWRGIILPSSYGEKMTGVFCVDTSGSMSNEDIRDGLSELRGIVAAYGDYDLTVIQADHAVQEVVHLTPSEGQIPDKAAGRGGTSFVPVWEYLRENDPDPNFCVYFTDGYPSAWGDPQPFPVLWVVTTDVVAPWGQTIPYKRE